MRLPGVALLVGLAALLIGCGEAPEPSLDLHADVARCVAGQIGAGGGASVCGPALAARVEEGTVACLVVELAYGGAGSQALVFDSATGTFRPVAPALDIRADASDEARVRLFLLQPGVSARACESFRTSSGCSEGPDDPPGCLLSFGPGTAQLHADGSQTLRFGSSDELPCALSCNDPCDPDEHSCQRLCATPAHPWEERCNQVDDDCDGEVDETCPCDDGEERSCGGVGGCAPGVQRCADGVWGPCEDEGQASEERCDGLDNDCDGLTDEGLEPVATTCGQGDCAAEGTAACVDGRLVDSCEPRNPAPSDVSCDGVDDDCDGQTDEDFVATRTTCGEGACTGQGWLRCAAGVVRDSCVPPVGEGPDDSCDGVDDDCDGQTDEDFVGDAICGTGSCRERATAATCVGGIFTPCLPGEPLQAQDTTCDGVDDDCDGSTDEEVPPIDCGLGVCRRPVSGCVGGVVGDCDPFEGAGPEQPDNGLDDDCDGQTDEAACRQDEYYWARNGHCYQVFGRAYRRSWGSARDYCAEWGGHLVAIQDVTEQQFVEGILYDQDYWIGLNDLVEEGTWAWDGGEQPEYFYWGEREPNDAGAGEDCVVIAAAGRRWNDLRCNSDQRFVCERVP